MVKFSPASGFEVPLAWVLNLKFMNENYWKKENPEYIKLLCEIETIECRIESGVITNSKTLKYKKRDLKKLYEKLREVKRYLE